MSALVDRHDITAQREGAGGGGAQRSELVALAAELAATNALIERQIDEFNAQMLELCVTDREPPETFMRNFPLPGVSRRIVHRSGEGGTFTLAAATPLLLLPAFETRLGISIVNSGSNSCTLFLTADLLNVGATPDLQGTAQVWLAGNGGAWDGRFGNVLWGGSVTGLSTAGTTVVVGGL